MWPRLIWWPVSKMTPPNIWLSLLRYGSLLPQRMKHLFKSWAKSVTDLMRCETGGDGEAPTASREKLPQIAIALVAFYFPKKCPCCNLFSKIRMSCIKVMPVSSTFKKKTFLHAISKIEIKCNALLICTYRVSQKVAKDFWGLCCMPSHSSY